MIFGLRLIKFFGSFWGKTYLGTYFRAFDFFFGLIKVFEIKLLVISRFLIPYQTYIVYGFDWILLLYRNVWICLFQQKHIITTLLII